MQKQPKTMKPKDDDDFHGGVGGGKRIRDSRFSSRKCRLSHIVKLQATICPLYLCTATLRPLRNRVNLVALESQQNKLIGMQKKIQK